MTLNKNEIGRAHNKRRTALVLGVWFGFKVPVYVSILNGRAITTENSLFTLSLIGIAFALWFAYRILSERSQGTPKPPAAPAPSQASRWAIYLLGSFFLVRALRGLLSPGITDTFEADSAALLSTLSALALVVGLQIKGGAFRYISMSMVIGTAGLGSILLLSDQLRLTGNSGYDLQILLPGAFLGIWNLVQGLSRRTWLAWISLVAVFATGALAATEPVVGAALVLAAGLLLTSFAPLASRASKFGRPVARLAAGLLLLALSFSLGGTQMNPADLPVGAETDASGVNAQSPDGATNELGGVGVRTLIWGTLPGLIGDSPMGVGTGQFSAAYPPYRDLREIELTSHNRELNEVFEVEHPHNDLLFALAEQGIAGGLLFVLGWLAAGLALLLALFKRDGVQLTEQTHDPDRRGFAFAGLAILAVSLFHSPLLYNSVASPLALLMVGMAAPTAYRGLVPGDAARKLRAAPLLGIGVLLALQCGEAWQLQRHEREIWLNVPPYPGDALEHRPDSFQANARLARHYAGIALVGGEQHTTERSAAWAAALAVRPHSIEALVGLGKTRAMSGDLDSAYELWSHARDLDPGYSPVTRNLRRLGADFILTGHLTLGLTELVPDLMAENGASPDAAQVDLGSVLFERAKAELELAEQDAQEAVKELLEWLIKEGLQIQPRDEELHVDTLFHRAFTCAAQWTWARDHASRGDFDSAIRSYRQALREPSKAPSRFALPLQLEYMAALLAAGRTEDADSYQIGLGASLSISQVDSDCPKWAIEALAGL